MVSSDEDAGTMTIRDLTTGEVYTLSYRDIQEGKLSVTSEDGEVVSIAAGDDGASVNVTGAGGRHHLRSHR